MYILLKKFYDAIKMFMNVITFINMNDNVPTVSYGPPSSALCAPAMTYIVISLVALLVTWMQNRQNTNVYCVGSVSCPVQSTTYVFVLKILWFLFWTWLLNVLCAKGYKTVAWILVAIPLLVFFTLIFGMANAVASGSARAGAGAAPSQTVGIAGTTAYNGKASKKLNTNTSPANPNEYVYGNKADKVGFFPNDTNTQYSSYASYDANLDNRAKFLDRESKGQVQPQQQQQPQQQPQ
jgi:uncharacterized membrane protein